MDRKDISRIETVLDELCDDYYKRGKDDAESLIDAAKSEAYDAGYSDGFEAGHTESKHECRKALSCESCTNKFSCWTSR
jgi:hypothetical protein